MEVLEKLVVFFLLIGVMGVYAYFSCYGRAWCSDKQIVAQKTRNGFKIFSLMFLVLLVLLADAFLIYVIHYAVLDKTNNDFLAWFMGSLLAVMLYVPYLFFNGPKHVISNTNLQVRTNYSYYLEMSQKYRFYGLLFRHKLVPCNRPFMYKTYLDAKSYLRSVDHY